MVANAELVRRIDRDLEAITAEARFLPILAEGWTDDSDTEHLVWHHEWRDLMARLEALAAASRSQVMTNEQSARYRALVVELNEFLPILQRLNLPLPPIPLDV